MHICALGLRGLPGVMGGVESHCEQLYPRIVAGFGHRATVLGRAPYLPSGSSSYLNVDVVPLPALRQRALEAISNALLGVVYARMRLSPDVLHIHAVGPALVTPMAKLLGMRTVVTHHGRDYAREKWGLIARTMLRIGERAALAWADRIIAVSPSLAQELRRDFPRQAHKISFIANGAVRPSAAEGSDALAARLYEQEGLQPSRFLLAVGRLVPEKGFADLIAALKASTCDLPLVIAGKADHEDEFARSLMAHAGERVRFIGFQTHGVLRRLYADAAVFVLPSHHEGLPIAALEAMASATPMLLSDIAANRDLGLPPENYFPVGDRAALSAALARPASDFAGYDPNLLSKFDWSKIAGETVAVYLDATARR